MMPRMGPVESAVRTIFSPPVSLRTVGRGAPFLLDSFSAEMMVLLLGKKQAYTPIRWSCLEGIPGYLRDRGWVRVGSRYEVDADPGTLDAHLKGCLKRATANWVSVVLSDAGVLELSNDSPLCVRLARDFA